MELLQGGKAVKVQRVSDCSALRVECPVCEAAPGVRCHVQAGVIRFDSHLERKDLAEDMRFERLIKLKVLSILNDGLMQKQDTN